MKFCPHVSVLLPVYNGEKYLAVAIESILNQSFADFELIILDDSSTDGSREIAELARKRDSRVVVLANAQNLGVGATLNIGLQVASGELIARMDHDDISRPTRLQEQVEFLRSNTDVGLLGARVMAISADGHKMGYIPRPETDMQIRFGLLFNSVLAHPTVVYRANMVRQLKLPYSPLYPHAEDYALWARLIKQGKAYNLQRNLVEYRFHTMQVSNLCCLQQQEQADRISSALLSEVRSDFAFTWEVKQRMFRAYEQFLLGGEEKVQKDS